MQSTRELRYIICPSCGDAVEARDSRNRAQCSHCNGHFSYLDSEIRHGLVTYDDATRRWKEGGLEPPAVISLTCRPEPLD